MFPEWALDGGNDKFVERLRDHDLRQKMREETMVKVEGNNSWESMLITSVNNPENKPLIGKYINQAAAEAGKDPYGKLGKGIPHPRNYGAFPRFLGKYVRDEKLLSLPLAIKKMTSMPAECMGLKKRGTLQKGNFADIVVFDEKTVRDQATFTQPQQYPEGIDYVLVNGKLVIENGEHTGELPGKIISRQG